MITLTLDSNQSIMNTLNQYPLDQAITLYLNPGIYLEKIEIFHHQLTIIGKSTHEVIILYHDYANKLDHNGILLNTFRTSTVAVYGHNVKFKQLTIRNDAGFGPSIGQAVALSVYGERFMMSNCELNGNQDTLFIGPLPDDLILRYRDFLIKPSLFKNDVIAYFENSTIQGHMDFIFGSGTALFNSCKIIAKRKGFIAAPSTPISSSYGLFFMNCEIVSECRFDYVYLARPWREHGSTLFIDCLFKGRFHPHLFHDWEKTNMRFVIHPYVKALHTTSLTNQQLKQLYVDYERYHSIFK
jgi:pectinesterase